MATGDTVVSDWLMEYRSLSLGGDTAYSLVRVEGLTGLPDVRSSDAALLRRHGLHAGDDFLGARSVVLTFELYAASDAALATANTALQTAFRPGDVEQPLVFQLPGVAGGARARFNCRPRRISAPISLEWKYRIPTVAVELLATDPRLYADSESGQTITLASAGGGLVFPVVFPLTFGAVSTGGTISAVNAGTFAAPLSIRIDGPVTNPRVENVTQGLTIGVDLTLDTGEFILIDTATRTVLLGGTASRYSSLAASNQWFDLEPGTNEIRFQASTTTAATLTLAWRSAWV